MDWISLFVKTKKYKREIIAFIIRLCFTYLTNSHHSHSVMRYTWFYGIDLHYSKLK